LTPSPQAIATPTATPSIPERASQHISQLQQAWVNRDWAEAVDQLAHIAAIDGSYPGLQTAQCDTYLHWALDLERECHIERAHDLYRRAIAVCQDRENVSQRKTQALLYLSGKWRYDRERWPQAAAALQELYDVQPDYAAGCREPPADADTEASQESLAVDVHTLLHNSLVASSHAHLAQNEFEQALQAAQSALALAPEDQAVLQLVNTIQLKLGPPPTPTPTPQSSPSTGKRIEINISRQRMYVWQGDNLLYDWACSTGKAGSDTATGTFRVQSKIPEAWGGQWSLRMPYWLGIYWVGTIENGIHALPISADGTTLWAGYLGTPVSFGCIILSTENARTLYHWAEIGTPVWIHH
jgi:tetratricopeptide (TPR) repeat protein